MSELTKSRFTSIDALRGIAAFLVVLYHVFGGGLIFQDRLAVEKLTCSNLTFLIPAFGYSGVYLFFVISGFCIHLRWAKARSNDNESNLKIDFFGFWKRRWLRLYPAYIAAIFLFLAWEYYQGKLVFDGFLVWDMIAHVLMIHNLDNRTVYSMNGVFWTLAIEEQLYLLYFLMLYLRMKWGWAVTLVITFLSRYLWFATSLLVTKSTGFELPFTEGALANWWIWAMGAFAVENYYKNIRFPNWGYSRLLTAVFLVSAGTIHYLPQSTSTSRVFGKIALLVEPFIWGAGFFFLINYATSLETSWKIKSISYKILKAAAFVGLFSYSLYLTHELIIQPFATLNPFLLCALSLVFAYFFFLVFEKPFMVYLAGIKRR